jgi:DNA-binding transcriptional regulator YhcF (GntR family)
MSMDNKRSTELMQLLDQAIAAMQTLHTQLDEMSSLLAESQRQAA